MIITDVTVTVFNHTTRRHSDSAGHAHPGPAHQVQQAMLTITTEDGQSGHSFCPPSVVRADVIEKYVRKVLVGQDYRDRERLWQDLAHWQRGSAAQLTDRVLAVVDCALWDLAGRILQQPVYKLKWSGKFGQRAKMYPTRTNGYENDKTTELFRPV